MSRTEWLHERLLLGQIAAAILWAAWIISIVLGGGKFDSNGQLVGADHLAFYSAARLITEGQGSRAYDYASLNEYQSEIVGSPFLEAFRNPPFYALLYLPTARLPFVISFWIWTAVSFVALWLAVRWLGSTQPRAAYRWALCFYPVFAAISFGQNSLLSLAMFSLSFYLLDRGRLFGAGLAAGLLCYKPQLLLGLVLWWVLSPRAYGRCLAGLAVTGLVLLGLSLAVLPEETRTYVERLRDIGSYDAFYFYNLHTPRGFWTLLCGDDKRIGSLLGGLCSVVALIGFVAFWRRHRDEMQVMFAAAVFVTLWASPHTMIYDWSLGLVPAILLWERRPDLRPTWLPLFAVGWGVLFVSTQLTKAIFDHFALGYRIGFKADAVTGALSPDFEPIRWGIQISVPVLAVLGIRAARALNGTPAAVSTAATTEPVVRP